MHARKTRQLKKVKCLDIAQTETETEAAKAQSHIHSTQEETQEREIDWIY